MSSNIRIKKFCEQCKKEYIAKTVYTRYCSHSCNRKSYKLYKLNEKIKKAKQDRHQPNIAGKLQQASDYAVLKHKELLTINEACALLNITHVTVRRWIQTGVIKSSRIGKKHIILRSHINSLLS